MLKVTDTKANNAQVFSLFGLGAIDCLTTYVGIRFFDAIELNSLMSFLVSNHILLFVAIKMLSTSLVCLTMFQAQTMIVNLDKSNKYIKYFFAFINLAFAIMFLIYIVLINNNIVNLVF